MLRGKNEGSTNIPHSVKIMSVRNMSGNTSNEWNEMNYTEELRNTKKIVLAHDVINFKINQI